MQNEKYIKFADRSTVEVLSLSRLDEGVAANDRRAATYTVKEGDTEVEYMVAWPNLTYQEIIDLNRSKAGRYNDTGKIPFAALVDPHTEKEMQRWSSVSANSLMDAVKEATKTLQKEHGKGITRDEIRALADVETSSAALAQDGDFGKALKEIADVAKDAQEWPDAMRARVDAARKAVLAAAGKRLDDLAALAGTDPVTAKRELTALKSKLRGTDLEPRVLELLATL